MDTQILPISDAVRTSPALEKRLSIREMSAEDWIERYASGTLRKNKRLGMAWHNQYLTERVAFEFGWEFELQPRSRVTFGDAFTEGDVPGITEAGWHIDRYLELSVFPEDRLECKYLQVEYADGSKKEGIGMVVRVTSAAWIGKGNLVFVVVAIFDPQTQAWQNAQNPF
ncbi:hypothetical protein V2H45_12985 [Tumidithrix elongata RA019]|uniref:Uncharacterized protein n=1 Tax=Tumidithrix elongata BACA0141 TaxID=2716417 RepID=A0AAW9PZ69_9CYAN|nr:hypothetical protein [Tumidithrix elongata RA019]